MLIHLRICLIFFRPPPEHCSYMTRLISTSRPWTNPSQKAKVALMGAIFCKEHGITFSSVNEWFIQSNIGGNVYNITNLWLLTYNTFYIVFRENILTHGRSARLLDSSTNEVANSGFIVRQYWRSSIISFLPTTVYTITLYHLQSACYLNGASSVSFRGCREKPFLLIVVVLLFLLMLSCELAPLCYCFSVSYVSVVDLIYYISSPFRLLAIFFTMVTAFEILKMLNPNSSKLV